MSWSVVVIVSTMAVTLIVDSSLVESSTIAEVLVMAGSMLSI
jgi:hypothetical protein